MFISFEGIDGSGKSTQARLLAGYLRGLGYRVVVTREPGGVGLAEVVRGILVDGAFSVVGKAELMLFEAARAQHVEELVRPALAEGYVVVIDRYVDSTVAYQGYGRGVDLGWIRALNEWVTGGLMPDLTVLLDLDVEEGLRRVVGFDRIERERAEFFERVRRGYLELAAGDPARFCVVDAGRGVDEIYRDVRVVVDRRLCR